MNSDIQHNKKRRFTSVFLAFLSITSESALMALGLLLILFGVVMALGLI